MSNLDRSRCSKLSIFFLSSTWYVHTVHAFYVQLLEYDGILEQAYM